jgi:RNA polymerase sigma-70 factor, ECF subfamily
MGTEIELLNKIKGNPADFSGIFELYYKPIFGYILRRTGNFDDAADIAADTFFKAFTNIRNFSYRGISIKVWLYRIATNEVNQFYRRNQKHNSLFDRVDFDNKDLFKDYLHQDKEELEAELQKHNQFLTIQNVLKTLPDKYQEVISLKYFEGKENKEIAEILNINEGTLKSLISRGLEKLREKCNQI